MNDDTNKQKQETNVGSSADSSQSEDISQNQPQTSDPSATQDNPAGATPDVSDSSAQASAGAEGDTSSKGPVLPPQEHLDQLDKGDNKSSSDDSSQSKKPLVITGIIIILLLVLGLGGYGVYAQIYMPERAPVNYIEQLNSFDSGSFEVSSVSTDYIEQEENFEYDLTVSGDFLDDEDEVAFDSDTDIEVGSGPFSFNANVEVIYVDEVAYMRTDMFDMLGNMIAAPGISVDSETWYSWEVDPDSQEGGLADDLESMNMASLGNTCTDEDREALEDYYENEMTDRLEITDANREDWFGVQRDGERYAHYSGVIEGTTLRTIASDMVDKTSEECLAKEDAEEESEDLENFALDYDLYRSSDRDELDATIQNEGDDVFTFTLTTSNYNSDVDISAPQDSEPLEDLMQNLGGAQNSPYGVNESSNDSFTDEDLEEFESSDFDDFEGSSPRNIQ